MVFSFRLNSFSGARLKNRMETPQKKPMGSLQISNVLILLLGRKKQNKTKKTKKLTGCGHGNYEIINDRHIRRSKISH